MLIQTKPWDKVYVHITVALQFVCCVVEVPLRYGVVWLDIVRYGMVRYDIASDT